MGTEIQFLLMLLTTAVVLADNDTDYCAIRSCLPRMHTLCRFPNQGWSDRCAPVIRNGLLQVEKVRILLMHNNLRMRVHGGYELRGSSGPQPPALSFIPLAWDDELAYIAQRWAEQCWLGIDPCRNVDRFLVNQLVNVHVVLGNMQFIEVERMIMEWYDEVQFFDGTNILHYRSRDTISTTHNYTQIVWADTRKVGCGAIRFSYYSPFAIIFLVCNYGPSGNIPGHSVYHI